MEGVDSVFGALALFREFPFNLAEQAQTMRNYSNSTHHIIPAECGSIPSQS